MGEQSALSFDQIGINGLPDLTRVHEIRKKFQVDLRNRDTGISARMCHRDQHKRLARVEIHWRPPDAPGGRFGESRIVRVIGACPNREGVAHGSQLLMTGAVKLYE